VKRQAVVLAWACTLGQAHAACPPPAAAGALVADGAVQLRWRTEPAAITVGQPFVLWLTVCPAGARLTAVDATMPEHRHGMNYRPTIQPLDGGRWRADGLIWHMSGRWELALDVQHEGATRRLRQSVTLP
jgi:hypothetical protein